MAKSGKPLPYIKTVRARGKVYEYFVTGKVEGGKPVLRRLPARSDRAFGRSYAGMVAARHARENVTSAVTMRELSRSYQLSPEFRNRKPRTQSAYLLYLGKIEEEMGDAPVGEIERRDVQALLDKMQDRPGAANMTLAVLRNLFKRAVKREWTVADPTRDVEALEGSDATHEPWPEQLIVAALADPQVRLPVALLYYTAQRIGDVCKMRWADIVDGYLSVTQEKTDKPLEIRIHAALAKILTDESRAADTIIHYKGKQILPSSLRDRLQRWAAKQGLHIVAHGLRKNAVNALLEAGCSVGETSAISGQSLAMVELYARKRNNRKLGSMAIGRWEDAEHG
jgi:integrase